MQPKLTAAELSVFLAEVFPQASASARIEAVGPMSARVRVPITEQHLRP